MSGGGKPNKEPAKLVTHIVTQHVQGQIGRTAEHIITGVPHSRRRCRAHVSLLNRDDGLRPQQYARGRENDLGRCVGCLMSVELERFVHVKVVNSQRILQLRM